MLIPPRFVRTRPTSRYATLGVVVGLLLAATPGFAQTAPGDTGLVSFSRFDPSVAAGGYDPAINAGGRYVVFVSDAANLVAGDTNGMSDIFVFDRQAGTMERVSVSSSGVQANDHSIEPSISADGRYVAFESRANNLAPDDTNFHRQSVFVRDRQSGTTELVGARGTNENFNPSISATGRYVAFVSEPHEDTPQIAVYDRETGLLDETVSVSSAEAAGNNSSFGPSISADGRYVAFFSYASNLVPNDTNGSRDAFVRDRVNGTTARVSLNSAEAQANGESGSVVISASGRFVAFGSAASNLVPGDTNGVDDVFVRNRQNGTTRRVSVSSGGTLANADSYARAISPDGRYIVFVSSASNLVPNDSNGAEDVFVRDTKVGTTERVSLGPNGRQANGGSIFGSISANGRYVAFSTEARNLAVTDLNETDDVFVRERGGTNLLLSPRALAFGNLRINTISAAKPVKVTNVSTAPVAITGVTLSGRNPGQFSRTHNCGSTLAAGAECTVNVVFRPTSIGRKSAYLSINGGGAGLRTVELSGTGVQ
jgi:Periplasmic component of the Tol biopolymer transport system